MDGLPVSVSPDALMFCFDIIVLVQILTFDSKGVSGHPNHCDLHKGIARLFASNDSIRGVSAWQLVNLSFPFPFKFLIFYDMPIHTNGHA